VSKRLKSRAPLYTTSEYLHALELQSDGNLYECKGKTFMFFQNRKAADYDAQWLVDYYKTVDGVTKRKPVVYRVKLERVK
jgi:hypothetical protein